MTNNKYNTDNPEKKLIIFEKFKKFIKLHLLFVIAAIISFIILAIIAALLLTLVVTKNDDNPATLNNSFTLSSTTTVINTTTDQQKIIESVCTHGHESYNNSFDSILGNYTKYSVAVDNAFCSSVGKEILLKNGSVIDAAIASGLCNGLMNSHSAGIGGGLFMVIYLKSKNKTYTIDARETAPLSSNYLMFQNKSSTIGGLATGIPGEINGYWEAYKLGGRLPWKTLFEPVIKMCREGYPVSYALYKAIKLSEEYIRNNEELSNVFINNQTNQTYGMNDIIKRPKLAMTFEHISEYNINAFYNSSLTQLIVKEINENGGNVCLEDFNSYKALVKPPVEEYIDDRYKIFTTQVPSSGLLVSFIMRLMKGFNLTRTTLNNRNESSLFYHRLIESFKYAFAHRSELGDENNENITKIIENLKNEKYIDSIRSKISNLKTYSSSNYGIFDVKNDHGTAHISILADGDAVSFTSTINGYFGAKYAGKYTGIIYNNQMDDFSTPNKINLFNLKPSEANYIKPLKRPMSSMSPTIIVDSYTNDVRLILGASGGTKILTSVAQVAIKNLWLGKNIKEAIDDRRVHHQLYPEYVEIEKGFDSTIQNDLAALGHDLRCFDYGGSIIQGISKVKTNLIAANCDARKQGQPDGL